MRTGERINKTSVPYSLAPSLGLHDPQRSTPPPVASPPRRHRSMATALETHGKPPQTQNTATTPAPDTSGLHPTTQSIPDSLRKKQRDHRSWTPKGGAEGDWSGRRRWFCNHCSKSFVINSPGNPGIHSSGGHGISNDCPLSPRSLYRMAAPWRRYPAATIRHLSSIWLSWGWRLQLFQPCLLMLRVSAA